MKVVVRPAAAADLESIYLWYEKQSEGLGSEFLDAVEATIQGILEFPRRHAIIHLDLRRALLRRFPYSLFYVILDDEIVIFGCFHGSRNPRRWKRRRDQP